MNTLRVILLIGFQMVPLLAAGQAQQYAFHTEEEVAEGWYHTHDIDNWVQRGADPAVIDAVLDQISRSNGSKRDPQLVDTQIEYGPGNWVYEWVMAGDAAYAEAQQLTGQARLAKLRAVLTYYSTGSWPHLGREDDVIAHAKSVGAYVEASKLLNRPVQHVDLHVDGRRVKAYFHLPGNAGPYPFVINSFGSDVTKESSFDLYRIELEPAGIGMLAVDMPGIGEARELRMQDGSDAMMEAALDYLQNQADTLVDHDKIFIVGGSFGGNAAARAFYRLPVAGVVSMCAPLHQPFVAPVEVMDGLPRLTMDGVKSRFGILDQPTQNLVPLIANTSLQVQGLMTVDVRVNTPLLVVTTNRDPVSPLVDLEKFLASAVDYQSVVLDMDGHCPPQWVREPVIKRWITERL